MILWILYSDIVFHISEAAKRGGQKMMLLPGCVSPVQNCAGGNPDSIALGMFPSLLDALDLGALPAYLFGQKLALG